MNTLNVGTISGGLAGNIVADEVKMQVMMRNATKEARGAMFESIERISKGIAQTMGSQNRLFRRILLSRHAYISRK